MHLNHSLTLYQNILQKNNFSEFLNFKFKLLYSLSLTLQLIILFFIN